jgi:dihydropyrimidine dehydrogenase (NAD+) subunit PreA
MWEGRQIITKLTKGLEKYLERNRFETPTDIIGKALPNIGKFPDLNLEVKMVASVDEERCNGCGICVVACNSGGYQAIELADSIVQINPQKCDGCGLCVGICPLTAVLMLPIDASK